MQKKLEKSFDYFFSLLFQTMKRRSLQSELPGSRPNQIYSVIEDIRNNSEKGNFYMELLFNLV